MGGNVSFSRFFSSYWKRDLKDSLFQCTGFLVKQHQLFPILVIAVNGKTNSSEWVCSLPSTNFRVTWSLGWLLPCLSASWYSIRENLEKRGKEKGNRGLQWWDWRMFMGLAFEDMNSPRVSLGLQWSMQSWHHPLCARMPSWRLAVSIHPQRLVPGLYQFLIILNSNAGHVGMLRNLWKQLILFMAFKNQKKMLKKLSERNL